MMSFGMTFLACLLAFVAGATLYLGLFFALMRAMAAMAEWRAGTRHPVE